MEDVLLNYGPLGIMLVLAIVMIRQLSAREQARADAAQAEVKRLNDKIQDLVIPMMERSAAANESAIAYLQQMAEEARIQERLKTDREQRSGN